MGNVGKSIETMKTSKTTYRFAFGVPLVIKLLKKVGFDNKKIANDILTSLVKKGVNYAEAWAKVQKDKPAGKNKKAQAISHVLDLAKGLKLEKLAENYVGRLIDAQVARDNTK